MSHLFRTIIRYPSRTCTCQATESSQKTSGRQQSGQASCIQPNIQMYKHKSYRAHIGALNIPYYVRYFYTIENPCESYTQGVPELRHKISAAAGLFLQEFSSKAHIIRDVQHPGLQAHHQIPAPNSTPLLMKNSIPEHPWATWEHLRRLEGYWTCYNLPYHL